MFYPIVNITALPMSIPNVTVTVRRSPNSNLWILVGWTLIDPNYNYTVILTNLNTDMVTEFIKNSENFILTTTTGNIANYNISVAAVNMCGNKISDPITVFSKSIHTYIHTYVYTYIYMHIRMYNYT